MKISQPTGLDTLGILTKKSKWKMNKVTIVTRDQFTKQRLFIQLLS